MIERPQAPATLHSDMSQWAWGYGAPFIGGGGGGGVAGGGGGGGGGYEVSLVKWIQWTLSNQEKNFTQENDTFIYPHLL